VIHRQPVHPSHHAYSPKTARTERGPGRIIRRWRRHAALAALAVSVAGCGTISTPLVAAPNQITFTFYGDTTEHAAISAAINLFDKSHPGASVVPIWVQGTYEQKVTTMVVGGEAPNVMLLSNAKLRQFIPMIQPVTINPSAYASQLFVKADNANGLQYGYPFVAKPYVLLINKTMFQQAGLPIPPNSPRWSIATFVKDAMKLNNPKKGIWGSTLPDGSLDNALALAGAGDFSANGEECTMDTPQALAAVNFMIDGYTKLKYAPTATELAGQDVDGLFLSGKYATVGVGIYDITAFAAPSTVNWAVVPQPGAGGNTEYDALVITKETTGAKLRLAEQFASFMSTDPGAQEQLAGQGPGRLGVPVTAAAEKVFVNLYPASRNMAAYVYAATHDNSLFGTTKETVAESQIGTTVYGDTAVGVGHQNPSTVLKQVQAACQKLLDSA